jgi:Regulator of chromosome condensation (RCC1) repeat
MGRRVTTWSALATLVALPAVACLRFSAFTCEQNEDCNASDGGLCLAEGSCAYPDTACASGIRYDGHADPDVAGDCVGDGGTGTGTSSSTAGDTSTLDTTQTTPATTSPGSTSLAESGSSETVGDTGDGCGAAGEPCCDDTPSCADGLACLAGSCGCVTQIAVGDRHSCAVTVDGALWCWGANDLGQLGDSVNPFESTPIAAIAVVPDDPLREVSAVTHTCVRSEQGNVRCFGDNGSNQVDPALMQVTAPATPATWIPSANHIGTGVSHSCATDGVSLLCWGSNGQSQLTGAAAGPGPIGFASGSVSALEIGGNHGCVRQSGSLLCWGSNNQGQLAQDPALVPVVETPTAIAITDPIDVALGRTHSCALSMGGAISCWGRNDLGQLGDGTGVQQLAPVAVVLPPEADTPIAIAAGFQQTCAINDFGELWCWGSNASGQLMLEPDRFGNDDLTLVPVQLEVGAAVLAVATGQSHSCVITDDARVLCWGTNSSGQIGDGTTEYAFAPSEVLLECPG